MSLLNRSGAVVFGRRESLYGGEHGAPTWSGEECEEENEGEENERSGGERWGSKKQNIGKMWRLRLPEEEGLDKETLQSDSPHDASPGEDTSA